MPPRTLRIPDDAPYRLLVGTGGIGAGIFFALEGDHTLGRNESRPGKLLDVRDFCKLHIIAHYTSILLGADPSGEPFHIVAVGKVGRDATGERMIREMAAAGMDTRFIETVDDRATMFSVCFQYPDGSGGNITARESAAAALTAADVDRVRPLFEEYRGRFMVLAAPEAPLEARHRLLELATECGGFRAASFASAEIAEARARGMLTQIDLLAVNQDEAAALAGREYSPDATAALLEDVAAAGVAMNPGMQIIVTVGREGAWGLAGGRQVYCPALDVAVAGTAGAGDALLGGTLAALAVGLPLVEPGPPRRSLDERPLATALEFGVLLAALTVTSPHTIHPDADLDALLALARERGIAFADSVQRLIGP